MEKTAYYQEISHLFNFGKIEEIEELLKNKGPAGSGIDTGTKFVAEESKTNKLVFSCSFHHMNDVGYYTNWTDHKIIVTPSFRPNDCDIRVYGRNQNGIKDYLADVFNDFLVFA